MKAALPDRLVREAWKDQPLNHTDVPCPVEWRARCSILVPRRILPLMPPTPKHMSTFFVTHASHFAALDRLNTQDSLNKPATILSLYIHVAKEIVRLTTYHALPLYIYVPMFICLLSL